jgi:hypothetical protein
MTIKTPTIQLFLSVQQDDHASIRNGLAIQILPSVQYLSRCFKHQFAAFIKDQACLVVWDDEPEHLVSRAVELESLLLATIWNGDDREEMEEKRENVLVDVVRVMDPRKEYDLEAMVPELRSIVLLSPTMVAGTLTLICSALGLGLRSLALETAADRTYLRFVLLAVLPVIFFMGLVSYFVSFFVNSLLKILLVYDAKYYWMSFANFRPS